MSSSRLTRTSRDPEGPRCVVNVRGSPVGVDDYIRDLLRASDESRQEIARKDSELQKAHERAHQLETQLENCHEHIFQSIDPFNPSDASISQELMSIQDGLANWVETLPDSQNFVENWEKLQKFLGDNGFFTTNSIPSPEIIARAEAELLTAISFGILWTTIFKPSLVGVSDDICSFLGIIRTSMSSIEPKKDRSWRSDTCRAWTKSPRYADVAEAECRKACERIVSALMLAGHTADGHWEIRAERLTDQILKHAATLAMQMRCSREEYYWDWAPEIPVQVQKHHLSTWRCVDLATHCQIWTRNLRNDVDSSVVAEYIAIMLPVLYRLIDGEQGRVLIGKGQLLVNTGAPPPKVKEEPKSPKIMQDQFLGSQVEGEPASPQLTQPHSTEPEMQCESSVAVQAPSRPAPRWTSLRWPLRNMSPMNLY